MIQEQKEASLETTSPTRLQQLAQQSVELAPCSSAK